MLKLVLGRQFSGKTYTCLKIAEEAVAKGEDIIMLVPEQYSFECQRHLLKNLGANASNKIQIHSFTSLCDAISTRYGGVCERVLDDTGRFLLLRQAVSNVRDSLQVYSKYNESSVFIKQLMLAISELKQSEVTPDMLKQIALIANSPAFLAKLNDISVIMSAYDALVSDKFIDPADYIGRSVSRMNDNAFFNGKTVIIDEFKGFTKSQYSLLDKIISTSKNTYVSLCCDSVIPNGDTDIFTNVKTAARSLIDIAKSHGVKVAEPQLLDTCGVCPKDIAAFEQFMAEKCVETFEENADNITVCKAQTVADEIDFVMNTIRRLVRTEGLRYRDFVIISRNKSGYSQLINEMADVYNIPCFADTRVPLGSLPFSKFVLSSLKAAASYDTEEILKYLKTGLAGLTVDEIATLENYVYVWGITGKKWLDEWNMNAEGLKFDEDEAQSSDDLEINSIRQKAIMPIKKFKDKNCKTAEDYCRALLQLCDECNTVELLKAYTSSLETDGKHQQAALQRAGHDIIISLFDKTVSIMGDEHISLNEFYSLLSCAVEFETVGEIPQTLDQVMYGIADRIRPMRPKVVFVIGANTNVFPASVGDGGFFSQNERKIMIDNGAGISDCSVNDCLDEKFLFYFSCCCASSKVFISYTQVSASGAHLEPTQEVTALLKTFKNCNFYNYKSNDLNPERFETHESVFRVFAQNFKTDNETVTALKNYFSDSAEYSSRVNAIESYLNGNKNTISYDSALKLYGKEFTLSASKIEDFNSCKFMYFCKRGIGAKALQKVDFDPLTRGNIVHYVLEHFINNHKTDIGSLETQVIKDEINHLCDEYINLSVADRDILGDKFSYMFQVLKETSFHIAVALNKEFSQSAFKPQYCELKIGEKETVKGISVIANKGQKASLIGSIDRVDTTDDGKVRVVDYKTGTKDFKLSSLLNGMNMQMLLYLYTVVKNGYELLKADKPAGVLYFPARRVFSENEPESYIKMNGLIPNDRETVSQMELDCAGKIVPLKSRPNGGAFYSSDSAIAPEEFDTVFKYLELVLQKIASKISEGDIEAVPLRNGQSIKCDYCDYRSVCRINPYDNYKEEIKCRTSEALERMKKEIEESQNGD